MDRPHFKMIDGPPFVSGSPHMGHLAIGSYKSAVCNAKAMLGYDTSFKLGYDCHGLPIEAKVASEQNLTTADIEEMGIAEFNKLCDETITKVADSWTPLFKKIGRNADFDNVYMTRDKDFMESVMWIFKTMWDKGLVYSGNKVMPYSYALQTPLSNFEAGQNYREISVKSVFVKFSLVESPNTFFVVWTTTPWTLPCNLALCVNARAKYCKVLVGDQYYILAASSLAAVFGKKNVAKYPIIEEMLGEQLVGTSYQPLFPDTFTADPRFYKVLADNYVKDDGSSTAIVHLAPGFGEDDFRVCAAAGIVDNLTIANYCPLDHNCKYTTGQYTGQFALDCSDAVRDQLQQQGAVVKVLLYKHSYPHCYRTDTPLIYRTVSSFFINVQMLKDRMIKLNSKMTWHPEEIGSKRFGNWLETAKDWAVSRYRYYGTPIPVWKSDDGDVICIGSIAELAELAGVKPETITNLHPEYINNIIIVKGGKEYRRVVDIFDCWFESGSVPFAQLHYPFTEESKREIAEREFLADFLCEGLDQTRGWFYTLLVISTAIADKAPAKNIVCTGLVLDEKGQKLSKKLQNYTDPSELLDTFGADIVRTYLIKSPLMKAQPLLFSEKELQRLRARLSPYQSSVTFLLTYLEMCSGENKWGDANQHYYTNPMDNWLLDRIATVINENTVHFQNYNLAAAAENLVETLDDITNWYLKLGRQRLKGAVSKQDQYNSLNVLYTCLFCYTQLWAPFMPFTSQEIFMKLRQYNHNPAIRKCDSVLDTKLGFIRTINTDNLQLVDNLKKICTMSRSIRKTSTTHASQKVPFQKLTIGHADSDYIEKLSSAVTVISNELNALEISYQQLKQNITFTVQCNYRELGKKFGRYTQAQASKYKNYSQEYLEQLYTGDVSDNDYQTFFTIDAVPDSPDDPATQIVGDLLVKADLCYDTEIEYYHQEREFISNYQQLRKKMTLQPSDQVTLTLDSAAVKVIGDYYSKNFVEKLQAKLCQNTNIVIASLGYSDTFKWKLDDGVLRLRFTMTTKN